MDYHIISNTGKIIASNLPEERIINFQKCERESIRIICPIRKRPLRHGKVITKKGIVYLATYDEDVTDRSFARHMEIYCNLFDSIEEIQQQISQHELKQFRRLKHNLVNYNTHILHGIYKFVSQDTLSKGGKNQIATIENIIKSNPRDAAELILKVLKNANLEKAEYDVYDMLYKTSPILEFSNHSIHKVIYLTLISFWLDFLEKKIDVIIDVCNIDLCFDYKSISVVLGHIFDNAIKYSAPNSNLHIQFKKNHTKFSIIFDMISLKIDPEEVDYLFNEGVSGKYSSEHGLNGGGYGLFIIKSLVELNKASIYIKPNVDKLRVFKSDDSILYENNQVILEFNYMGDKEC